MNAPAQHVLVAGGGPAGSVAALCLRKLGHQVTLFEKTTFPRYRIGESLLPGTMSILSRLGVFDRVQAAGFTKKTAATFLWGEGRPPWSFTFSTPKTAPWTFDHSFQVNRAEFDQILLDSARERGVEVKEECAVLDIMPGEAGVPARLTYRGAAGDGEASGDFAIDATGAQGVVARKYKLRRFDPYFRNMAFWSYFRGGKRYKGDLEGNILSVTFRDGWMWLIPLKDDVYSVGIIVDKSVSQQVKAEGIDKVFADKLKMCPLAVEVLEGAEQVDDVHLIREWAYDATQLSVGNAFLCGDSACFIDPLFSQGVHLATYSGMMAAAAIDHLGRHPHATSEVTGWFDRTYRSAYNRYHKFLTAFYSNIDDDESSFWSSRRISRADDTRFEDRDWFASMTGQSLEGQSAGVEELKDHAATLAHLWHHGQDEELTDDFDEGELSRRRVKWAGDLVKEMKSYVGVRWSDDTVTLVESFRIVPPSFKLQPVSFLSNGAGRVFQAFGVSTEHKVLFERTIISPMKYRDLAKAIKALGGEGSPLEFVLRLFEEGFLTGIDNDGNPVRLKIALRFGGVGAGDDMS